MTRSLADGSKIVATWLKNIPLDELKRFSSQEFINECFNRGMDVKDWPIIMIAKNVRIFGSLENYIIDVLESPKGYKACIQNPNFSLVTSFLYLFKLILISPDVSIGTKERVLDAMAELTFSL